MALTFQGRVLVAGNAQGEVILSYEPLSFWGGVSPYTGEITDRRHDHSGVVITDKVFLFPKGRGSSTGSAVLLEAIRNGTAPAAIINTREDPILALGAMVAEELYQRTIPVLVVEEDQFNQIRENDFVQVFEDGRIIVNGCPSG